MHTISLTPAGDGLGMVWAAEFDELAEIGVESACPALQASLWCEAASERGEPVDRS